MGTSKSNKAFVVYPRTKAQARDGLTIKGKRKKFTGGTFMNLRENEAKEVEDTYGKDNVHIVPDEQLARAVNSGQWDVDLKTNTVKTVHRYTFGTSQQFSDAWEQFEKRRKDKKRKKRASSNGGRQGVKHG